MKAKVLLLFCLSLVITSFVWVDEDVIKFFTEKFENYTKRHKQVKVHLFFNQDKYSPGDTAFYKAHFLTDGLQLLPGKQILNLELYNQDGKIVQHQSFSVRDGVGANQIILSKSISPGIYLLVVYSDWMRNFGANLFYQKQITITGQKRISSIPQAASSSISFYPEGGKLVEGIPNRVVVRSSGVHTIQLIDDLGQVRAEFMLDDQGLGSFLITPEPNMRYFARITGNTQQYKLPGAASDGIALHLTSGMNTEPLKLLISTPATSELRNQNLYLMMVAQSRVSYSVPIRLGSTEAHQLLLPQRNLPEGVTQLYILNEKGIVLAERLVFIIPQSEIHVGVSTDKATYHSREKVVVEIVVNDELGNPIQTDLAVSVLNKKLFPDQTSKPLSDELLFTSDFYNSSSSFEIDRSKASWLSTLDNYLITQKWNRFQWSDVLTDTHSNMQYGFRNTLSVEGIALDGSGLPVPDSTSINVFLQEQMMGYEVYTQRDGQFDLPFLFDFWGDDRMFYLMEKGKKEINNSSLIIKRDTLAISTGFSFQEGESTDSYGDFKFKKGLIDGSFSFYANTSLQKNTGLLNPNAAFEDELFGADVSINVEEYVIFPTMEELIREVIPSLLHRKVPGKSIVRVMLSDASVITTGDPLYIIDGVMSRNSPYFLSLKPSEILSVKIVKDLNKLQRFGAMGKNGIVLVQTKKPDSENLTRQSNIIQVKGLSKPLEFRSPDYATKSNTRIPDFRSTLYWDTSLKTDSRGKASFSFYTSDDSGPLEVKLEGITSKGNPFSGQGKVMVVFDQPKN
jgi:hypothetical protein